MYASRSNTDIWQSRLHILLDTCIPNPDKLPANLDRLNTIKTLLLNLRQFGEQHFNFFYGEFDSSKKLTESDLYPPEHVYSTIVDQVGYDISVLEHIIHQRSQDNPTLAKADCLAQAALGPAIDNKWLPKNTVALCYYQKFATVRVIPYADVALVGIPYSCVEIQQDLLSIPHEVGHYVYWRGTTNIDNNNAAVPKNFYKLLADNLARKNDLQAPQNLEQNRKKYQEIPQYILKWTEEIFADIYACKIAGEQVARTGQDIMSWSSSSKRLYEDDREHPPSIFRPYIYHKALAQQLADDLLSPLQQEWVDKRKEIDRRAKNIKLPENKFFAATGEWVYISDVVYEGKEIHSNQLPVDYVINEILGLFSDLAAATIWSGYKQENNFETENLPSQLECNNGVSAFVVESSEDIKKKWEKHFQSMVQNETKIEKKEWISIWSLDGWTTDGPTPDPRSD